MNSPRSSKSPRRPHSLGAPDVEEVIVSRTLAPILSERLVNFKDGVPPINISIPELSSIEPSDNSNEENDDAMSYDDLVLEELAEAPAWSRYISLFCALAMAFGPHFAKAISSLKTFYIHDKGWNHGEGLSNTQWGFFQSSMVLPNLIVPMIGGFCSQTGSGMKWTVGVFLGIVFFGDFAFWFATREHMYWFALFSRFVTGCGEGVSSALSGAIAALFFSETQVAFAIGVSESFHALSNSLAKGTTAIAAEYRNDYSDGVLLSVFAAGLSFIVGLGWVFFQPITSVYTEVAMPNQNIPKFHFSLKITRSFDSIDSKSHHDQYEDISKRRNTAFFARERSGTSVIIASGGLQLSGAHVQRSPTMPALSRGRSPTVTSVCSRSSIAVPLPGMPTSGLPTYEGLSDIEEDRSKCEEPIERPSTTKSSRLTQPGLMVRPRSPLALDRRQSCDREPRTIPRTASTRTAFTHVSTAIVTSQQPNYRSSIVTMPGAAPLQIEIGADSMPNRAPTSHGGSPRSRGSPRNRLTTTTLHSASRSGSPKHRQSGRSEIASISSLAAPVHGSSLRGADYFREYEPSEADVEVQRQENVLTMTSTYWGIVMMHLFFSLPHRVFGHIDAAFLQQGFNLNVVDAGLAASSTELLGVFVAPILGATIDYFANDPNISMAEMQRTKLRICQVGCFISACVGCSGYALLAYGSEIDGSLGPYYPLALLAMTNSVVPSLLKSAVPQVLRAEQFVMGFAFFEIAESLGVLFGGIIVGQVQDDEGSSGFAMILMCFAAVLALNALLCLRMIFKPTETTSPTGEGLLSRLHRGFSAFLRIMRGRDGTSARRTLAEPLLHPSH